MEEDLQNVTRKGKIFKGILPYYTYILGQINPPCLFHYFKISVNGKLLSDLHKEYRNLSTCLKNMIKFVGYYNGSMTDVIQAKYITP